MRAFSRLILILIPLAVSPALTYSQALNTGHSNEIARHECYMLMAGKDATFDGSVLVAHTNDLSGNEASLIEKFTRTRHAEGARVKFPSGLEIPQMSETFSWMVLRIYKGFAEGDAIAINEYQVSIGGGVALGSARNIRAEEADPLIKKGLTGGVRYIALQRTRTARECVELIGSLYSQYGVTYPSGVSVADPDEVWYIESGGGRSWAAVRVPDHAVWVQANGYRIGEIDPDDTENYMCSQDLLKFAEAKGLWNPDEGPFNFARAFGQRKKQREGEFYNTRRVWRGVSLLCPSQDFDPDAKEFPMFIVPEKKVDFRVLIRILRDHYQGTPYDVYAKDNLVNPERGIAVPQSIHTSIVQLRGWLPADIGAVMYAGVGPVISAIYVPYYFGITSIPTPFAQAEGERSMNTAFWVFRELADYINQDYYNRIEPYVNGRDSLEAGIFLLAPEIEKKALALYSRDKELGNEFLTTDTYGYASRSLELARSILQKK